MRKFKILTLIAIAIFSLASCKTGNLPPLIAIESKQFSNLYAPQTTDFTTDPPTTSGEFVKFDFATGDTATSGTDWDIAFRGTTILVNGGTSSGIIEEPARTGNAAAYIAENAFANVNEVTAADFVQDRTTELAIPTGSGNSWYSYIPEINAIQPIAGKVIVFRTADDRYAKMEILSYYKDAPSEVTTEIATHDGRYYTFNYVYQPNENITTFEP